MCDIKLTVENEGADLLMTVTPVKGQPKANLKKLQRALKLSDYSAFLLVEGSMELLLAEIAKTKANDNDENSEDAEPLASSAVVANAVDATLEISLDAESMSATLELKAGYGGKHIKNSDVVEALKENNVIKGIIKKNLINIVKDGIKLQGGKSISTEIAKGKISINGKNGYIKYLVDDPVERVMRPKKLDNGNVDMRELGDLIFVKTGRKLAQVIPPTYGSKGFNVIGKIIDAVPGENFSLEESEGSSFLDENNNILIAAIDGMPKYLDKSVTVNKLLEIENIDVGSGNIRFDGSIYVKGDVCEGMELSASEDIVIGGVVESATITSGGDITIALGIIGRQVSESDELENSTVLQAKGDISAQFVQYADISSKGNIKVVQYISHCQIIVEGDLWVGNLTSEKADGKIFGSFIQSGSSIYTGTLGSPCGAMTNLNFNYWEDSVEELRMSTNEKIHEIIRRLPQMYKLLQKTIDSDDKNEKQLERIKKALKQHLGRLGILNKGWLEKESKINVHLVELELAAYQSILSGVNIEISSKACVFKRDYEATRVQWIENKVNIEPIVS
ncbi:MAG: FapA family protein [Alteromonadaceae bacterium]|jgi:uncharacterized protein (DUF342 family)